MTRAPAAHTSRFAAAFLLALFPTQDPSDAVVLARINDKPVEARELAPFVLAELGTTGAGTEALDLLVQELLVELEAARRGLHVTDADVDVRIARLEQQLRATSDGKLGIVEFLRQKGVENEEFRASLRKAIPAERMMTADYGLPADDPIPPEKQSLWFQEQKRREAVVTVGLPEGIAARAGNHTITRTAWGVRLLRTLPAKDADKLFDDYVGIQLILAKAKAMKLEVTPRHIDDEVAERTRLLHEKLASQGLAADGVDYLKTLEARGDDPQAVLASDRFKAEILLKEITRQLHGEEGFQKFYVEHKSEFDIAFGRKVRVATIFLRAAQQRSAKVTRTWPEAEGALDQLKSRLSTGATPTGDAFASLARVHSEHESAQRGGDLGLLGLRELEKVGLPIALLDAKPGELVGPLATQDGVHLLLVGESRAASPFEEIRGEVEKEARREVLRTLRKDVKIEKLW